MQAHHAWSAHTTEYWAPTAPIVLLGARTERQFDENLAAVGVELPSTAIDQLEAASAIDPGVPTSFLRSPDALEFFYGSTDISPLERGVR